jgi:uroporphyrinogen decarboxylase
VPLIGFAGSPFTLATYLAEGGGAREFTQMRRLLRADRDTALLMLDRLTEVAIAYLKAQVAAGAQAIQLFDTWIGALAPADFRDLVLPYLQRIFASLEPLGVPRIYFANGASHLVDQLDQVGADVLSLDWRANLDQVWERVQGPRALQGNLDPCALFGSPQHIERAAGDILRRTASFPHIFNLGHGVLPDTPVDNVRRLIDAVHAYELGEA